ncbi:MAG: PAS domain S-box protein, partial [Sphingobacteriales bacterium]
MLLEAIPELKGQPAYDLLEQVYRSGETIERKHTPVILQREGRKQTGYFDFTYAPLIENGKITGIIDMAVEVTDQFEARMAMEQSANQLRQMVMNAPMGMCIIRGQDLVIEIANQPMLSIWTRSAEQVLGKQLTEVFPEVIGQPYPAMLRAVLDTGETLAIAELTADIAQTDGTINRIYIDFTYKALKDSQGNPEAIMATVTDITEAVKARKLLEQSRNELQDANQELGSANEEYIALNEELVSANERLTQAQEELRDLNELINIAIDAGDLGYTEVDLATGSMRCNDNFKRFYGRSPGQQLTYPQMFEMMLPEHRELVRAKAIQAREQRSLYHAVYPIQWADGSIHWINAYGRGRYDDHGNADRMVGMVSEITEQKMAEQAIEKLNGELSNALEAAKESEERMDLAISAANMGTFHINLQTRELIATVRTRELFGLGSNEPMSLFSILSQIEENYRSAVTEAFKATLSSSAPFAIEFPVSGLHNQKQRWLRAVGRCYGSIADHAVE